MYAEMPILFIYTKQNNKPTCDSAVKSFTEMKVVYKEGLDNPHYKTSTVWVGDDRKGPLIFQSWRLSYL